jgi:hypothetical protein
VLLITTLGIVSVVADVEPDPLLLLQGVASTRLQTPPSSLTIRFIYRDRVTTNEIVADVDFDGASRGFTCDGDGTTNSGWRTLVEEMKAVSFEEKVKIAEYQSLGPGNRLLLFDPRILGLTHAYAWDESVDTLVPSKAVNFQAVLIGKERVGNQSAWHVRVLLRPPEQGDQVDYWIDDTPGFRVYRRDWNGVRTFSYYENPEYDWLPSRVISRTYDSANAVEDATPHYEKEMRIVRAKGGATFPKRRWTLAALSLKPGTVVFDRDLNEVVGKWNGKRVVSLSASDGAPAWSYVLVTAVLLAPVMLLWRIRTRQH